LVRGSPGAKLILEVGHHRNRKHLRVVELKRVPELGDDFFTATALAVRADCDTATQDQAELPKNATVFGQYADGTRSLPSRNSLIVRYSVLRFVGCEVSLVQDTR
jgi:hypothetical protein